MAVSSLKNKSKLSTLTSPFDIDLGGMIPLATVAVTSATATVTFSDIPQTYEHLQIRGIMRDARTGTVNDMFVRFNSDTGSNYAAHKLNGDGSSATAGALTTQTSAGDLTRFPTDSNTPSVFGAMIMDILDYSNTNKYKTIRVLGGYDANGSGVVRFASGLWQSTSAVTSILIDSDGGVNWSQHSSFSLYGIKRAGA